MVLLWILRIGASLKTIKINSLLLPHQCKHTHRCMSKRTSPQLHVHKHNIRAWKAQKYGQTFNLRWRAIDSYPLSFPLTLNILSNCWKEHRATFLCRKVSLLVCVRARVWVVCKNPYQYITFVLLLCSLSNPLPINDPNRKNGHIREENTINY